jgi:hypothetical protein
VKRFYSRTSRSVCDAAIHAGDWDPNNVTICFRCDDICASIPGCDVDHVSLYNNIFNVFSEMKVPLTIGVVPNYHGSFPLLTEDRVAVLLNKLPKTIFRIALHGLTHEALIGQSEWLGAPLPTQLSRLSEGVSILHKSLPNHEINTFLPPWNSFDYNTVLALKCLNFSYISGDAGIVRNIPTLKERISYHNQYEGISIVPATCSLKELNRSIDYALNDQQGCFIICIFHPYDFKEYYPLIASNRGVITLSELRNLLKDITSNVNLSLSHISDLVPTEISAERYTSACIYVIAVRLLLKFIPHNVLNFLHLTDKGVGRWLPKGRYLTSRAYKMLSIRSRSLLLGCSAVPAFIFGYSLSQEFSYSMKMKDRALIYFGLCLLILFVGEYQINIMTSPISRGLFWVLFCSSMIGFLGLYLG